MPALITSLIDKRDTAEIVRDKLAEILLTESDGQQALATLEGPPTDPLDWKLRVFIERTNPWEVFLNLPDTAENTERAFPIVNVSRDNESFPQGRGNTVERQIASGVFFLDVYGYAVAHGEGAGHVPGDYAAAVECQRAMRLVRNILMAGAYTYLGMRGVVARRWPQSIQQLELPIEMRTAQQIAAMRLSLEVDFNEFAPQVEGPPLEVVSVTVKRAGSGEAYFVAQYGEES